MRSHLRHVLGGLAVVTALGACGTADPPAQSEQAEEPPLAQTSETPPPDAAPGTCWGMDVTPAVIETVTDRVMTQPPEVLDDGTVVADAVYKLETRQAIVQERRELWFETPCEEQLTPDFVASVQRALAARGHYRGTINGEMDAHTRRAIRRFQAPLGIDSSVLSLAAARKMGLVAVERSDAQ
ncbi:peptidoglycan-binding domain-containing protein [Aquicoccus sp.]|uniref:peptidoglycan-binding domain-containing protein n=1 Tax=Aquicoccus sp. TaxID=2055851 RepID=UPI00356364A1